MNTPLSIKRTAIEVVREGRFRYVVVERMDSGLDGTWEPSHWFRWRAVRHARKLANPKRYEPQTVLRIDTADHATEGAAA